MSRATGIINRLNKTLIAVNPNDRDVYKRVSTKSGGDPLTGQSVVTSVVDTKLDPPPSYQRLGRNIVGNTVPAQTVLSADGTANQTANDYMCLVSPTAMSREEMDNPNSMLVFYAADGSQEVFRITDVEPVAFEGIDIILITYIRSTKRGTV